MNIGHIGHNGSKEDRQRVIVTTQWLDLHEPNWDETYFPKYDNDFVNLINKRDFLAETQTYDIVIVHYICRGVTRGFYKIKRPWMERHEFFESPLNSWNNWVKRLENTNAKHIFVFGSSSEISGDYLMQLREYNRTKEDDMLTVFTKVKS